MSECLDAALAYAARGWPVLPLNGKLPRTEHGCKDASTEEATIRRWWTRWPDANVGLATGGELVVLDVDPRHGGDDALAELERHRGDLPETALAQTGGGGEHYYFAHPGGDVRGSANLIGDGLDVKARGGYVVAPPSLHESGRRYEWDVPPEEVAPVEPPEWLAEIMRDAQSRRNGHGPSAAPDAPIPEGGRNNALTSLAGRWRHEGKDADEIEALLGVANRKRCKPPLADAEVRKIAESVGRYPTGAEAPPTPEGGEIEALNAAVFEIGGNVKFLRVRQVGLQRARWYITVRGRKTGQPVELASLTTKQLRVVSNLSELVYEARAGELPTPSKGSERYGRLMTALIAAAEFEEHGATEAGAWRRRLAAYVTDRERSLDPTTPEGKAEAITSRGPFESPDGRLWVHAGSWLEHLETRRQDADDAAVRSALRHLDFEPKNLSARVDGKNQTRWYWRGPEGFDLGSEQA